MDTIRLSVEIGADRRLVIDLPPDTLIGQAELIIKPHAENQPEVIYPARETARAILSAAGALSAAHRAPEGALPLSPAERQRVWQLFSQGRSSDEIINEDRGTYLRPTLSIPA